MTISDLLSIGTEIEFEGKTYALRDLDQLQQGRYKGWLVARAHGEVDAQPDLDDDARDRRHNLITRDAAAGVYDWEGPAATRALQTPDGMRKLFEVMCGITAADAQRLYDGRLSQIRAILRAALEEDPKKAREALKELGLPATFLDSRKPRSSGSGARRSTRAKKKSSR